MKRALSLFIALVFVFACAASAGAEVLYDDAFDELNEEFWVVNGSHFTIEDGRLDGWDDAVAQQSISDWNNPAPGAFIEYTAWVDVFAEESAAAGPYMAGIWYTNICSYMTGYLSEIERYKLEYCPEDSTVYLTIETDRKIKGLGDDMVLGSLKLEDEPGQNFEGDPVRLGLRVESGKITAYANGKLVCEHSYAQIGQYYSPMILWNTGCHAAFDNFVVGDLNENVAVRTRPDDYVSDTYTVTVEGGSATYDEYLPGDSVFVVAAVQTGKSFERWELVEGEGVDEALLTEPTFTFVMPECDVVLRAVFSDAVMRGDVDGNGRLNAKDVSALMKYIVGTTPVGFIPVAADFDQNGKINAKDVAALMKEIVNPS